MDFYEKYMHRCLQLAARGGVAVAPNPLVGAVLVYKDRIIGEGWHQQYGQAHAEVNCLNSVSADEKKYIPESMLFVNLEPCSHYGKTPPCADLIIQHCIKKVVIGCVDPFSKVSGKGIAKLQAANIAVTVGILEQESRAINKRFFTFHQKKRPYIFLKWAQSADGLLAPEEGRRVMLSNELTSRYVHKQRSEEAAILIGYHTARLDNPQLTNRYFGSHQPLKVVIDERNALPDHLLLKKNAAPVIIFNYLEDRTERHIFYKKLNQNNAIIPQILKMLYENNIVSLIVEGGAKTLQKFINENLWDEALIIHTPVVLNKGIDAPVIAATVQKQLSIKDNTLTFYRNASSNNV